jgi:hypothetical protein
MSKSQKSIHSIAAKNMKNLRPEMSESPLGYLSSLTPGTLAGMLKPPQTSNFTLARLIERIKNL